MSKTKLAIMIALRTLLYIAIVIFNVSGVAILLWGYGNQDKKMIIGGIILITISMLLINEDLEREKDDEEI